MQLRDVYDIIMGPIKDNFFAGAWPTIKAIFRNPTLLVRPRALSKVFMFHLWNLCGDALDDGTHSVKEQIITPYACGVVLDIGAGYGHSVHYLDHSKATKYVAIEPNTLMHNKIREHASKEGFKESDGSLVILPYGVENTSAILSALGGAQVDTVISVLTLCSVPSPEKTINAVVRDLIRPGGQLLFREHVLSKFPDVARWQRILTPIWRIPLDGCRLDRPTDVWIEKMGVGENIGVWKEGRVWSEDGDSGSGLLWHRLGRYVKN